MNLGIISICLLVILICVAVHCVTDDDTVKSICNVISATAGGIIGYSITIPFF